MSVSGLFSFFSDEDKFPCTIFIARAILMPFKIANRLLVLSLRLYCNSEVVFSSAEGSNLSCFIY